LGKTTKHFQHFYGAKKKFIDEMMNGKPNHQNKICDKFFPSAKCSVDNE
jgi:hypothetical protein